MYKMSYSKKSKSQKKSQSKNGGRRRKHTMRKLRRGRKVMRGGDASLQQAIFNNDDAIQLLTANSLNPTSVTKAQIEEKGQTFIMQLRNKGVDIANY